MVPETHILQILRVCKQYYLNYNQIINYIKQTKNLNTRKILRA